MLILSLSASTSIELGLTSILLVRSEEHTS